VLKKHHKNKIKWVIITITTIIMLEVFMSYSNGWNALVNETVSVQEGKSKVKKVASLMPKTKTLMDTSVETMSPISDYFKYFYNGNQEYLKQMSEGRIKSSKIYKEERDSETGYADITPTEFANNLANDLTEFGLNDNQIAGIIGSLDYESLGFTRYKEIKGPGISAAQYTNMRGIDDTKREELIRDRDYAGLVKIGARKDAFIAFSQDKGYDPKSYEAFRDFMFYEFRNTSEGRVIEKLEEAQSPEQAADIFTKIFLRPKKETANLEQRRKNARDFKEG
tara:strand:- start:931 stop:1770 length:840 start_codon:yes stop_codon:yes gene_type:complete